MVVVINIDQLKHIFIDVKFVINIIVIDQFLIVENIINENVKIYLKENK